MGETHTVLLHLVFHSVLAPGLAGLTAQHCSVLIVPKDEGCHVTCKHTSLLLTVTWFKEGKGLQSAKSHSGEDPAAGLYRFLHLLPSSGK